MDMCSRRSIYGLSGVNVNMDCAINRFIRGRDHLIGILID